MITKEDIKQIKEMLQVCLENTPDLESHPEHAATITHIFDVILHQVKEEQTQKYASEILEPEVPTVSDVLSQEPTNFMPLGSLNNPLEVGD